MNCNSNNNNTNNLCNVDETTHVQRSQLTTRQIQLQEQINHLEQIEISFFKIAEIVSKLQAKFKIPTDFCNTL